MGYEKTLIALKGIGKKTADDIMRVFPKEELLAQAVSFGEKLPFEEDINKVLKEAYAGTANTENGDVLVYSEQPDMKVRHYGTPSFVLQFVGHGPVRTTQEVADYLIKQGRFYTG